MKIVHRYNGETIYENDNASTTRQLVELAVKEGVSLKYAYLFDVDLTGANFTGADLRMADFRRANLRDADFTGANLIDADFTSAVFKNANINGAKFSFNIPKIENIHEKIYEAASGENALNMDDWHTCKTTHCIAGWAIVIAGKEGAELEKKVSTKTAATLIYLKSDKKRMVPDFYNTNEGAMKELKELAKNT